MAKGKLKVPGQCNRWTCRNALEPGQPFVLCEPCRRRARKYEARKREERLVEVSLLVDSAPESISAAGRLSRSARAPHDRPTAFVSESQSTRSQETPQKCSHGTCAKLVDPTQDFRTCLACRVNQKDRRKKAAALQRKRLSAAGSSAPADEEPDNVPGLPSGETLAPAAVSNLSRAPEPLAGPVPAPEVDLEPEIVEIKPTPDVRFPPTSHPQDEERLREAVLALAAPDMDAYSVVLISDYLRRYFSLRAGRKPSALQMDVARTLLANPRVDEELRVVLRSFYNVLWI